MDSFDPTYSEPVSWKIFFKKYTMKHIKNFTGIYINNRICLEQYVLQKKNENIKSVSQNRT